MRVVVTGGAGFVGSHLSQALIERGDAVVCIDNLLTGARDNVAHLEPEAGFSFVEADVTGPIDVAGAVDAVLHLASPASPVEYQCHPLETLAVNSRGTENALQLAGQHSARFVLASTSEVYGDPLQHPQPEDYWGNVNPIGPRSVYDESKRFAEALTAAYRRTHALDTGIVRIFNTFGPRMRSEDGRVVSNFCTRALTSRPLTIYGDGSQTRSLCYVDDLVRGLLLVLDSAELGPFNLGNPRETTMLELAETITRIVDTDSVIEYGARPVDDPHRRRPVIDRAQRLGWSPRVSLEEGLRLVMPWFAAQLSVVGSPGGQPSCNNP